MLRISQSQFAMFREHAYNGFRVRAVDHVCAKHSATLADRKAAEAFVDFGLQRAAHYRIGGEEDILKFLDIMIVLAADFESRPEHQRIVAILSEQGLAWQRLNRIRMLLEGVDPDHRMQVMDGAGHG